jgi:hypothetical protein
MQEQTLARRARAEMLATIGDIVDRANASLRTAGLSLLDEDEVSTLYLHIAEGRDAQKALNDITRARRWDPSTRVSRSAMLSISLEEDAGCPGLSTEDIAPGHYLADGESYTARDRSLRESSRLALVRALLRVSEIVSADEMLAAASTLNATGAWEARLDAHGRKVGRPYAASAFRIRCQREAISRPLDSLAGIVQEHDAAGLLEAAARILGGALEIDAHYLGWFGEELAEVLADAHGLLEAAAAELREMHAAPQAQGQVEEEGFAGEEEHAEECATSAPAARKRLARWATVGQASGSRLAAPLTACARARAVRARRTRLRARRSETTGRAEEATPERAAWVRSCSNPPHLLHSGHR